MTGKAYKVLNLETMKSMKKPSAGKVESLEMDVINKDLSKVTDAEIISVLTLLELDQLLHELAQGLDTLIGDFGRIISGGEAKRLSVARVLLAEADVYIFDEPTEHLDEQLAQRIEKGITRRLADKITIVVTHSGWESIDKTLTMKR